MSISALRAPQHAVQGPVHQPILNAGVASVKDFGIRLIGGSLAEITVLAAGAGHQGGQLAAAQGGADSEEAGDTDR